MDSGSTAGCAEWRDLRERFEYDEGALWGACCEAIAASPAAKGMMWLEENPDEKETKQSLVVEVAAILVLCTTVLVQR